MRIKLSALTGGGSYSDGCDAGVWFRGGSSVWNGDYDCGFRAAV